MKEEKNSHREPENSLETLAFPESFARMTALIKEGEAFSYTGQKEVIELACGYCIVKDNSE